MALLIDALNKAEKQRQVALSLEGDPPPSADLLPAPPPLATEEPAMPRASLRGEGDGAHSPPNFPPNLSPSPLPKFSSKSASPAAISFRAPMVLAGILLCVVLVGAGYWLFQPTSGLMVISPHLVTTKPNNLKSSSPVHSPTENPSTPSTIPPSKDAFADKDLLGNSPNPEKPNASVESFTATKITRQQNASNANPITIHLGAINAPSERIPAHPLLDSARQSLERGQWAIAASAYLELLKKEPNNIEALQNMGVIAYNAGFLEEAQMWMRRVLQIQPDHPFAQAMIGGANDLSGGAIEPPTAGAASPLLMAQSHFITATRLADQGLWSEAQNYFFQAWHAQSDHPDYAYNLAVSLDRLGQSALAAQFYERALTNMSLPSASPAHFSADGVRARLALLRGTH